MTLLAEYSVSDYMNANLDKAYFISFCIEQAESWVRRRMGERKVALGYVCVYEFDETAKAWHLGPVTLYQDFFAER